LRDRQETLRAAATRRVLEDAGNLSLSVGDRIRAEEIAQSWLIAG
jgi:hypothetical protein